MYKICGKIDILKATILPNQDISFLVIYFSWVSSLAINGLMLALVREEVVFIRVIFKYNMLFLLHA